MNPDYIHLIAAFLIGGMAVMISTIAAERFGSVVGGVIAGFPSTFLVAVLFLLFTKGTDFTRIALIRGPASLGIYGLSLLTFGMCSKKSFWIGLGMAFFVWMLGSIVILQLTSLDMGLAVGVFLLCFLTSKWILCEYGQLLVSKGSKQSYSAYQVAARVLASGFVVFSAVAVSKWGGPEIGGIAAFFPVTTYSTIVIFYLSRGKDFARSMTLPFVYGGMWNSGILRLFFISRWVIFLKLYQ